MSNATTTPKVSLRGVSKSFDENHVLTGVDLDVGTGQSVVLVGASGCGKTLLLKTILGLMEPDAGSVLIDGKETAHLSGNNRDAVIARFGMQFQKSGLFDSLPIWENVGFQLLQEGGMSRTQVRDLAADKLAIVGMGADVADLYPSELSGGMQKRVGLVRAIAAEPEILLLDEPTAGLDPIMSEIINELILKVIAELGVTVISVNSDMTGAKRIAGTLAMLHDGHIIWCGPSAEAESCGNPFVEQFILSRAEGPIRVPGIN